MEIAIIADTHMPRGGRRLPERCRARLAGGELIIHAGDLVATGVLEELRALGPPVVAVAGNVDEAALQAMLPQYRRRRLRGAADRDHPRRRPGGRAPGADASALPAG